ncbi:hypothetical protein EVAR_37752_1 [Eumeta japonica]|uniref:Uncharacterized protein n=1 Tax=Eumeta variegata TaxID=151549 RepID=A0A4C1WQH2_EUMVA|nr:hypothetical protein EVAR_37752_1 [Eumeta japonica]
MFPKERDSNFVVVIYILRAREKDKRLNDKTVNCSASQYVLFFSFLLAERGIKNLISYQAPACVRIPQGEHLGIGNHVEIQHGLNPLTGWPERGERTGWVTVKGGGVCA